MDRWHDAHTEVNEAALVADAEAAVLRDAALGDIELRHDLDAGEDGLVVLAGDGGHGLLQDTVDAVLDEERVVEGLEVDIGGAAFERGEDGGVDEADDGREIVFAGEALDGDVLVGIVFGREDVERQPFRCFVEDALGLLGLLEQIGDLREGGDAGDEAGAEEAGDLVEDHELGGVGDGDGEAALVLLERHEVVAEHHVDGDGLEELVLDFEVFQVDELGVVAAGEDAGALVLVHGHFGDGEWEGYGSCHEV